MRASVFMKRFLCTVLVLMLLISSLVGCERTPDDGGIEIVCTVFPIYDWVDNLLGESDDVSLRLLVNRGTDPHSYTPTPTDIAAIHASDVLIYVGGESDAWVRDVLETVKNEDIKIISLLDMLGDRAQIEETVEGMQCEDEDCHDHDHDHEGEHAESGAYDEHVWLSLKNAQMLCDGLADELAAVLPDMAEQIDQNCDAYREKIVSLNARFEETIAEKSEKLLIFADRFPFRYLIEDYSLDYFAAFSGCSADSEATFETVVFLSEKLRESSAGALMILESSTRDLANTIISNSGCEGVEIIVMDSMQSINTRDINEGVTYLSIMEKNLAAISAALK